MKRKAKRKLEARRRAEQKKLRREAAKRWAKFAAPVERSAAFQTRVVPTPAHLVPSMGPRMRVIVEEATYPNTLEDFLDVINSKGWMQNLLKK